MLVIAVEYKNQISLKSLSHPTGEIWLQVFKVAIINKNWPNPKGDQEEEGNCWYLAVFWPPSIFWLFNTPVSRW